MTKQLKKTKHLKNSNFVFKKRKARNYEVSKIFLG